MGFKPMTPGTCGMCITAVLLPDHQYLLRPGLKTNLGAIVCRQVSHHNTSRSRPRHCGTAAAGSAWRCRRTTRSCRWRLATPRSPGRGGSSATTRPTWPTSNTSNGCFQNVSRLKIYQLKLQSFFSHFPTTCFPLPDLSCLSFLH